MTLDDLYKVAGRAPRIESVAIGDETAYVRGLTAGEVDDVSEMVDDEQGLRVRCLLVAKALCDEKGNALCGEVGPAALRLSGLPEWTLKRLYLAVDRASDVEPGGTEALAGNSGGRAGDSSTASPSAGETAGS